MAMLHRHPIIVQGEWKDEKEKERLIEVCCKACVGGYSGVAMVLVGRQVGVACARKRMAMSWPPLSCNSSKQNENKEKKHLTQCFGRAKWVGRWGGCVAHLHARGQHHCPATCNGRGNGGGKKKHICGDKEVNRAAGSWEWYLRATRHMWVGRLCCHGWLSSLRMLERRAKKIGKSVRGEMV